MGRNRRKKCKKEKSVSHHRHNTRGANLLIQPRRNHDISHHLRLISTPLIEENILNNPAGPNYCELSMANEKPRKPVDGDMDLGNDSNPNGAKYGPGNLNQARRLGLTIDHQLDEELDADELSGQFDGQMKISNSQTKLDRSNYRTQRHKRRPMTFKCRVQTLKNKLLSEKEKNELLSMEIDEVKTQVVACQDDLLSLQPVFGILEFDILKDLDGISERVVDWVARRLQEVERLQPGITSKQLFKVQSDNDAAEFLEQYPDAGEYYVRHAVHGALHKHIFLKDLAIFCLPDQETELMQAVLNAVHGLQPPRDPTSIRAWKAETLLALSMTTFSRTRRMESFQISVDEIHRKLYDTFPVIFQRVESTNNFIVDVVTSARELAMKMKTSTSDYQFATLAEHDVGKYELAQWAHFESRELVDATTRASLHSKSPLKFVEGGFFGRITLQLEPKFVRINESSPETILRKETWLVHRDGPFGNAQ